eukprot:8301072-Lingulodinium_polyedra.AAC.1
MTTRGRSAACANNGAIPNAARIHAQIVASSPSRRRARKQTHGARHALNPLLRGAKQDFNNCTM